MTLNQLYEQVCTKNSIKAKLDELYSQQQHLEEKLSLLKSKWQKEQNEADRLEKGSLSSFFYSLTGHLDEKLEKETREALEAKAVYDNAVFQLENVKRDISRYVQQQYDLKDIEQQYETALKEKLDSMKNDDYTIVLKQNGIVQSQAVQKEINEAVIAGKTAMNKAYEVQKSLDSADSWAMFDVFGGGIVADMVKYSKLDDANSQIQQMQASLSKFKTELSDVNINADLTVQVSEFLRAADYLFDNIFTDAAVLNRISEARNRVNDTVRRIDEALLRLENMLKSEKAKEAKLKRELENIAVSAK